MSTHDTAAVNGSAAVDPLAEHIRGLEEMLTPLVAERAQLEAQLADITRQEQRIKAGINALTLPAPRAAKAPGERRSKHDWSPSQATLDKVFAVIDQASKPLNITEIAALTETSRGTVEKACDALRRDERIRLAGVGGRGKAKLYAVMP